jgi:SnoaL-like domain
MSISLPSAISLYVAAENSGEVESLSECFTPDAMVRDERRTYTGLEAIKEWKAETNRYNHTIAPLEVTHRDGRTVLKATLTGNFPGSPVTLEFAFVLKRGKIKSLEMR